MLGQTVSHYKILEKLGEGGMGVVYKAEDSKLKRLVALKFLPPRLTRDQEAIARFVYEAQTASSLDHQNICTIHEIDQSDEGRMFIGMAFYDGETLKKKVSSDQLSVSSVVAIAIQVAQGLAKAHEKGIIHRDIKPSNIIVQADGPVKIIDFGLAKLLGTQRLTKSGAPVGTVAYMSPEQARGHEVDQRTDLWSLGVVLYEMLTGELPFKGELDQAVIYSILDEQPEPITKRRENVPAELEWIVNKALAKDSSARYQHAGEMLGELQLLKNKIESGTAERLRIGARPARRKKVYLYAGVAVLIILLIGSGLALFNGRDETVDSVAVLPFENAAADAETDYLSDGITESLIYSLSQLPRLKVIARSSVFRYKGQALNPQSAAHELGVRAVVTGRIAQRDSIFSISVELVDSRDNSLLWGRQYNRRLANLLTIQEELAKEISGQLRPELRREEQQQAAKSHTENIAAYQLYLKGRYFWNKRTAEGLNTGIKYFQQAIAKDSAYAKAYAGLTDCYTVLAEETGDPQTEIAKARAAAMKALELDETLAEAHTALGGLLLQHDWNWPAAEKEFKRAIALNPNDATAHQWYSICLEFMGRPDEAIAEAKRAVEVDPLTSIINQSFGYRLYMARQYDRALEQLRQTLEIDSTFSGTYYALGYVYAQKKMYEEAIAAFQKARQLHDHPARLASLGYGYAVSGKRDQAQRIIAELKEQAQQRYVSTFDLATIYVGLGEREQTFAWLEKAYEEHNGYLPFLKVDPIWDGLRADPRFAALLKKAGLE